MVHGPVIAAPREAEAGRLQVQGQPGIPVWILGQLEPGLGMRVDLGGRRFSHSVSGLSPTESRDEVLCPSSPTLSLQLP